MKISDVVIVDFLRSPFSRSRPKEPVKDLLNEWRMDEVLGMLWNEMLKRNKVDPKEVDEAITGTANPANETFTFGGKFPLFYGKLPLEISAQQVDQQCGSALAGLRVGAMAIAAGFADVVLCGGQEHMTHCPMGSSIGSAMPMKLINDPEYKYIDLPFSMNMGFTAQKLQEMIGTSREEMDKFAMRSHQLAAQSKEWLKGEIMPIKIHLEDGTEKMYDYDAAVRGDTTLEALASLKPAYKPDGTITAGNASPLNAGATAMLIMSRDKAKKLGLKPLASFVSFGMAGVDPTIMGAGPVPSTKKALKAAGLQAKDIDYWEINEAFAIVSLYAIKEFGLKWDQVNVHGGAMAIGHPLGASGIRLVGTLARILREKKGKYGVATMCEGGGQGVACIIKAE
ncbi:MAG: acetyl-CoA C-acetyltransferase [Dehalococcoidia bacterium]|nr:acetyl-CoA C-acetyltransferase [Dehalococcoidia bacterium]MDD5494060.1 acetyl-CoA C-acetyltransferase [Dehalococcoidia bacterium]